MLPTVDTLLTGRAEGASEDWARDVLPWIARNVDVEVLERGGCERWLALFETEADARAAGSSERTDSPLWVEIDGSEASRREAAARAGFVGFAPGASELFENAGLRARLPIYFYARVRERGEGAAPGDYVRRSGPRGQAVPGEALAGKVFRMVVDFAEAERIRLADHFAAEQCTSWSDADLQLGATPRAQSGPSPSLRISFVQAVVILVVVTSVLVLLLVFMATA